MENRKSDLSYVASSSTSADCNQLLAIYTESAESLSDGTVQRTRNISNSRHWWTNTGRMQRGLSDPTITLSAIARYSILRISARQTV